MRWSNDFLQKSISFEHFYPFETDLQLKSFRTLLQLEGFLSKYAFFLRQYALVRLKM